MEKKNLQTANLKKKKKKKKKHTKCNGLIQLGFLMVQLLMLNRRGGKKGSYEINCQNIKLLKSYHQMNHLEKSRNLFMLNKGD